MISRSDVAIKACGGDQHLMILMASQRTRELVQGAEPRVVKIDDERAASTAIREIEQGLYTVDEYKQGSN
jgi:DNA-directed RNA polymerase omega subunit